MNERLPSLNALRALDAAGRHLSLTRAAVELNVTPAAVSHQIRLLERDLGVTLLERKGRGVMPTPAALAGMAELRRGFDHVAEAVRRMRDTGTGPLLRVTSETTFAGNWLVPRLARFRKRCPHLDVLIDASDRLVDFDREDFDIGIRWGGGDYPGLAAERLFDEEVFAVCHHSLILGEHPIAEPRDLAHHTLIHLDWPTRKGYWPTWEEWLDAAGVKSVDTTRGLRFTVHSHALRAAVEAQGVVLTTPLLVDADLKSGLLVEPFDLRLPTGTQTHVVHHRKRSDEPAIQTFREWLLEEAKTALVGMEER
ncbi:MAG: transcriptional regulator GcvA [Alphaproteobacteria bacterium]|nr:transcriptional regulator GcvA [Alphaproteobacteria bacterium]